jgi:hypothetical protein
MRQVRSLPGLNGDYVKLPVERPFVSMPNVLADVRDVLLGLGRIVW